VTRIRLHRTEAIVLKRHDYGEADRILTLYTPDLGKVAAVAKGVRRITSRQSGHVELFTHAGVLLAEGRDLYVLTQADTVQPFRHLREDLVRTTYAYHIAETADRFLQEGVSSPPTFRLLVQALGGLEEAEDPSVAVRYFEVRLLGLQGYQPRFFHCSACDAPLGAEGNAFSPEAGGVLCPACAGRQADAFALPDAAFRVLRFLQTRDWSLAREVVLTPSTRGAVERVMHAYVHHLLERELRSVEFLRGLRQVAGPLDLHPAPPLPGTAGG